MRLRSRVGPKGQAVIPKPVREQAGIIPGDEVYFRIEHGVIMVEKRKPADVLEGFLGAVRRKKRPPARIDWDARYRAQFRTRAR